MQGLGLFTLEQCVYLEGTRVTQRGQLFTTGPGTYKIPSCQDIPIDFRVTLLGRAPNPKAIFSSKVSYCYSLWNEVATICCRLLESHLCS